MPPIRLANPAESAEHRLSYPLFQSTTDSAVFQGFSYYYTSIGRRQDAAQSASASPAVPMAVESVGDAGRRRLVTTAAGGPDTGLRREQEVEDMLKCIGGTVAAAVVIMAGCSAPQQVYLRPQGRHVEYSYTYYPELRLSFPPVGGASAVVRIGARGMVKQDRSGPDFEVYVEVEVDNMTRHDVLILREQQVLACIDGEIVRACEVCVDGYRLEGARVVPGEKARLRLRFDPQYVPGIDERVSFVYRLRYAMSAQAWPENIEFARILPGDVRLPTVWNGVLIIRF